MSEAPKSGPRHTRLILRWADVAPRTYAFTFSLPHRARLVRVDTKAQRGQCVVTRLSHANVSSLWPEKYQEIDLADLAAGGELVCPVVEPQNTSCIAVVCPAGHPPPTSLVYLVDTRPRILANPRELESPEWLALQERGLFGFPPGPFLSDYTKKEGKP